ncbi:MAG TPA: cytochrome c biogenesis protein CcdA [Caulobacteraceae bacterium]|nr:cytochrome c biogenesis protein CcdA [Caulobacteraceae bacterium]
MSPLTFGAAGLAGVLTVLSPCVLPILPVVFSSAQSQSRLGPAALAMGVAAAFTGVGLFVATVGFALGLDPDLFHRIAGVLLLVFGLMLLTPRLQVAAEAALAPFSTWAAQRTRGVSGRGPWGQAGLGLLLGAVWSPCVGPTLGAASLLASQGKDLGVTALTMLVFGIGASAPLLLIGQVSRASLTRMRGGLSVGGRWGKLLLGGGLVLAGALAVSGLDKVVESFLVDISPAWLTRLTSSV